MKHYLFSKTAFDLLTRQLSAGNTVFQNLDAAMGLKKGSSGSPARVVTTSIHCAQVINAINDHIDWHKGDVFVKDSPPRSHNKEIDAAPLLTLMQRYKSWLTLRASDSLGELVKPIGERSIKRAFLHLMAPELPWEQSSLDTLPPPPIGLSDRRRGASLLSFIMFGCDIEQFLMRPDAERFVMAYESSSFDEEDKKTADEGGSESQYGEAAVSKPTASIRRLLWRIGIGAAFLVVLGILGKWAMWMDIDPIRQSIKDVGIKGDGNHVGIGPRYEFNIQELHTGSVAQPNGGQDNLSGSGNSTVNNPVKLANYSPLRSGGFAVTSQHTGRNTDTNFSLPKAATKEAATLQFSGVITDQHTLTGVSNAKVMLATGDTVRTDAQGRFHFTVSANYATVSQRLYVNKEGYRPYNTEITLGDHADYPLTISPQ